MGRPGRIEYKTGVCRSCVLRAGIDQCWEQLRDFGRFSSWIKSIEMAGTALPVNTYMLVSHLRLVSKGWPFKPGAMFLQGVKAAKIK